MATGELTRPGRPAPSATGAPEPARAPREQRPLEWSFLPKLTREDVAQTRALGIPTDLGALLRDLGADLSQDLGAPCTIALRGLRWTEAPLLAAPGCYASIEVAPQPGRVLVEVDLGAALALADRLLGGPGARPAILRGPTTLERGVLSYLFLRALARLEVGWTRAAGLRLRLLGIREQAEATAGRTLEVSLAVDAGAEHADLRLHVPEEMTTSLASRMSRAAALPGVLAGVEVSLGVEIMRSSLSAGDLAALAVGDAVFCEERAAALGPEGLGGEAWIRPAAGRAALLAAVTRVEAGYRLTVRSIRVPGGASMSETPEAAAGARVLAEAQIPVTVELGRLTLAAEEVAGLRAGDTLLLARAPGAPVDLCAGGKVIARGELVDVEGELGVRILALAG